MFKFSFTKKDAVRVGYAALFAFIGAFVVAANGLGPIRDMATAKAAGLAGFAAGLAAALSAAKNAVLADDSLAKG